MGEAPEVACPLFANCPVGPTGEVSGSLVPLMGIAWLVAH